MKDHGITINQFAPVNMGEGKAHHIMTRTRKNVRRLACACNLNTFSMGFTHKSHKPIRRNPVFGGLFIV